MEFQSPSSHVSASLGFLAASKGFTSSLITKAIEEYVDNKLLTNKQIFNKCKNLNFADQKYFVLYCYLI